jgi:hypothetical protein
MYGRMFPMLFILRIAIVFRIVFDVSDYTTMNIIAFSINPTESTNMKP